MLEALERHLSYSLGGPLYRVYGGDSGCDQVDILLHDGWKNTGSLFDAFIVGSVWCENELGSLRDDLVLG